MKSFAVVLLAQCVTALHFVTSQRLTTPVLARARFAAMAVAPSNEPVEREFVPGSAGPPPMPLRDGVSILAGTAVGGGFLALPSVTAPMGFGPAVMLLTLVWAFLAVTGVAYAEAAAAALESGSSDADGSSDAGGVSVASITERTFGGRAAYVCSAAFAAQMLAVVTAQARRARRSSAAGPRQPRSARCKPPPVHPTPLDPAGGQGWRDH